MPYAQHARQGFGRLVAATALTLVVVALAARRAPRSTSRERTATAVVLRVLCLATTGVVATAVARLGAPLDVAYLCGLSADAVPALDEPLRSCVLTSLGGRAAAPGPGRSGGLERRPRPGEEGHGRAQLRPVDPWGRRA